MTLNILFSAPPAQWDTYADPLRAAFAKAGVTANLSMKIDPAKVDYIVYAPNDLLQDFAPYTRAKAVLSLWAGVERIVGNDTLQIPLARMVDPGLTKGMVEWVTAHVLRYHLALDLDVKRTDTQWVVHTSPLAQDRSVVVLGMGALGRACAETLAHLGFNVTGWSRSPKDVPGMRCLHGDAGRSQALQRAEIAVLLLPDTPGTENTLNAETLAQMPPGAFIINPGRGPLIDDDALLAALNSGHIAGATLDVFRTEPLPKNHPYWAHPNVTVTPHIAAETRALTSAKVIADNIQRSETGRPLRHLVDRTLGY
jgi:glyoxylate/hydroxypyruvate reductase A